MIYLCIKLEVKIYIFMVNYTVSSMKASSKTKETGFMSNAPNILKYFSLEPCPVASLSGADDLKLLM